MGQVLHGGATVKRFHYDSHDQFRNHLTDFVSAHGFGRRLKTLKDLTPYESTCKTWTNEPARFRINPLHQMPGLNTWLSNAIATRQPRARRRVWPSSRKCLAYASSSDGTQ